MTPCLEYLVLMSFYLDFLIQVQQSCSQVPYWSLCQGLRVQQEGVICKELLLLLLLLLEG